MANKKFLFIISFISSLYQSNCEQLPSQRNFLKDLLEVAEDLIDQVVESFLFVDVPEENVKFLLYSSSSNETTPVTSHEFVEEFLNPNDPTKILIHGFTGNAHNKWIEEIAFLYHEKGAHNVIAVDWAIDAAGYNYIHSSSAVQSVGYIVGDFILNVTNHVPNFLQSLHLIGHSLGSHVAGFAGKQVNSADRGPIDRITGLDPAGPLFEIPLKRPASLRMDQSDANFVDAIHTDVGLFGVSGDYGTVDFFVNGGGPIQPNCESLGIIDAIVCSHGDSHVAFKRTIEDPERYEGVSCDSERLYGLGVCEGNAVAFMGDEVRRNASGNFYVDIG